MSASDARFDSGRQHDRCWMSVCFAYLALARVAVARAAHRSPARGTARRPTFSMLTSPPYFPQTEACLHGETKSIVRHGSMAPKTRLIIAVVSLSPVQHVWGASDATPPPGSSVRRSSWISNKNIGPAPKAKTIASSQPISGAQLEGVHILLGELTAHHDFERRVILLGR